MASMIVEPIYLQVSSIRPAQLRRLSAADRARLVAALRALIGRIETAASLARPASGPDAFADACLQ
jgi:hypothetical protein